jgi:hypothetical protein
VPPGQLASVKSLYPLGQPEKALGHEPQIDLCVANQATGTACSAPGTDRRHRYWIKMRLRWNHAGPASGPKHRKPKPNDAENELGAGSQGMTLSFQSREKNTLDIPSYRSGDVVTLRHLFALEMGLERYRDFYVGHCRSMILWCGILLYWLRQSLTSNHLWACLLDTSSIRDRP